MIRNFKQLLILHNITFSLSCQIFNRTFRLKYSTTATSGSGTNQFSHTSQEEEIVHLDDRIDIRIPEYPIRPDEPLEQKRQR